MLEYESDKMDMSKCNNLFMLIITWCLGLLCIEILFNLSKIIILEDIWSLYKKKKNKISLKMDYCYGRSVCYLN